MRVTKALVTLDPVAVELVDRTILEGARRMPEFAPVMKRYVRAEPDALLLVEFAGEESAALLSRLEALEEMLAGLGLPGSVVRVTDGPGQAAVWNVRSAGLNIVSDLRGNAKPVSIIEDCAVPLEHLAEYTERLTGIFERHGTRGTWYAHASVGCLHVRPVLDMKSEEDVRSSGPSPRRPSPSSASTVEATPVSTATAWSAASSTPRCSAPAWSGLRGGEGRLRPARAPQPGENRPGAADGRPPVVPLPAGVRNAPDGDRAGLVGVGWAHRRRRDVQQQRRVPEVRAGRHVPLVPRDPGRAARRPRPGERAAPGADRPARPGRAGLRGDGGDARPLRGLQGLPARVPHRRGHGADEAGGALAPPAAARAADEGPGDGPPAEARPVVAPPPPLLAHPRSVAGPRALDRAALRGQRPPRISLPSIARPFLPAPAEGSDRGVRRSRCWSTPSPRGSSRRTPARPSGCSSAPVTASRYPPPPARGDRSAAAAPSSQWAWSRRRGARLGGCSTQSGPSWIAACRWSGLEPSCLLTLRDELVAMLPGEEAARVAGAALTFEELIARERAAGRFALAVHPLSQRRAVLHGHCHQKAFGLMGGLTAALQLVPGLEVESLGGSCCGMAGSFGYEARHLDVSMRMAERSAAPRSAQRTGGRPGGGGRVQLPAPDSRRHGTHGAPRGPGTGRRVRLSPGGGRRARSTR